MTSQFFSKLSQDYIKLLEDSEFHDITIEVGDDPNVKILRAHMNILCYRSPYLRRILTTDKKNNDNSLTHVKLQNISPEIFQIVLKYIYGGILSLDDQDTSNIIKILLAANNLLLQELVDYLQKYLIENKSEWLEQHFEFIHRISFQYNSLLELQKFCTDIITKSPEKIFKSIDFTSLPENSLVQLIKRDDLQMREIEIWNYILKWGFAQNPTLISDPNTMSDNDFKTVENTLQHCLPLIRFFNLSSKEFLQKVRPYKKLLKHQLYEDLLNSYLDPDSKPTIENILSPRNIKIDDIIDSKIVNFSIYSVILMSIDREMVVNVIKNNSSSSSNIGELYLPYKFELLLRGSRDGFTPKKFHELCDGKDNTVTFIKAEGTEEIIGGYNPLKWESSDSWGKTNNSFIFSFKNKNNFIEDAIISNVKNANCAINCSTRFGPLFGSDIIITASNEFENYNTIRCRKCYYKKKIRDTEDQFSIEDYEVFQIVKK